MRNLSFEEKRKYPRVPWQIMVHYRGDDQKDIWQDYTALKNISVGGCYFGSGYPYRAGEDVEIKITLPGDQDPMILGAKVRHNTLTPGIAAYCVGLEFANLSELQKKVLADAVKQFLEDQKKKQKSK